MTQIFITQFDLDRLNNLLDKRKPYDAYDEALITELSQAKVIDPKEVPPDVVTMNSQVRVKDGLGDSWKFELVFPEDADLTQNKVSILSPVGCSLIGFKVGDSTTIPTPKGRKKLIIEEIIYQPERSGDFDR